MSQTYTYQLAKPSKSLLSHVKNYDSFEKKILPLLEKQKIQTTQGYNTVLRGIKKATNMLSVSSPTTSLFKNELALIQKKKPLTETTVWGGVTLKKVDVAKDLIQKFLIVKKNGVLGFEIHKQKSEHLRILEGYSLIFWINHHGKKNNTISLQLAGPTDAFTFEPKDEHGILALTDSIIEETSTNHLDDLVYIFNASL